jgi:hypothetical protein
VGIPVYGLLVVFLLIAGARVLTADLTVAFKKAAQPASQGGAPRRTNDLDSPASCCMIGCQVGGGYSRLISVLGRGGPGDVMSDRCNPQRV